MLFNSYIFLFAFLPVVLLVYYLINYYSAKRLAMMWLLTSSLLFYGWWNFIYVPLLASSVLVNYLLSRRIRDEGRKQRRKMFLTAGLVFNVGLLGVFKYSDFFIDNVNIILGSSFGFLNLALPLAISFFTLQQVMFLVDTYEGLAKENRFITYAVFVCFFPQLIAGPIVRHSEMMEQFASLGKRGFSSKTFLTAIFMITVGLTKKVVIADSFSVWASEGFGSTETLMFFESWIASLSYTFQLYFDFSGYSDMAVGLGLMFNIRLPINFLSPYASTSVIRFWQRWHITLSSFIFTYLYVPIVRSLPRVSFSYAMLATLAAMVIAGLWHGAAWTFLVFGLIHGVSIVLNHMWRRSEIRLPEPVAWLLTFTVINIGFVFFRADSLEHAVGIIGSMMGLNGVGLGSLLPSLLIGIGFAIVLILPNVDELTKRPWVIGWPATLATSVMLYLTVSVLEVRSASEFLYFQF